MTTDKPTLEEVFENMRDLHTIFSENANLVAYPSIHIKSEEIKEGTTIEIKVYRTNLRDGSKISFNGEVRLTSFSLGSTVNSYISLGEALLICESLYRGRSIILKEYFLWMSDALKKTRADTDSLTALEEHLLENYGGEIIGEALKE